MSYSLTNILTQRIAMNMPTPQSKSLYICNINSKNQKVCFNVPREDSIICEKTSPSNLNPMCQLSVHSFDESLQSKLPSSIFTNIESGKEGFKNSFYHLGTFPKSQYASIISLFNINIPYSEIDKIEVSMNYKTPPSYCAINPWKEGCSEYIQNVNDYKIGLTIKPPFIIIKERKS